MKRYVIRNPFVERKYWLGAFWGIMLAMVAVVMDKCRFHVWLTNVMIAIQPGLGGMRQSMIGIGHCLYKGATCVSIVLMAACAAPLAISYIAQIVDAISPDKEE